MKKHIKIIGIGLVAIFIIGYFIYAYFQPLTVETLTLSKDQSEIYFIEKGHMVNSKEIYLYPAMAGEVKEIHVKRGDQVKAGDVLASMDNTQMIQQILAQEEMIKGYQAQKNGAEVDIQVSMDNMRLTRAQLVGQLKGLEAEIGTEDQRELEAMLVAQSKERYEQGLADLEKYRLLFEEGIIAESEFNDFKTMVNGLEADYQMSQVSKVSGSDYYKGMKSAIHAQISSIDASLKRDRLTTTEAYYQSMIDSAKASLSGLKAQAEEMDIKAPHDGYISDIMVDGTNRVSGMEPAFLLIGDGVREIQVKVNTRDIEYVHEGDGVELIYNRRSGEVTLTGRITYVANNATVELSPLGIEERKVLVIIEPEVNAYLETGYEVDVKFIVFNEPDKLILPNSALYKRDDKDMVLAIRDGKVEEVPVTLGYELTGRTVIEEGVEEGEVIITDLEAKGLKVGVRAKSS
ncbi:HlyD family secretion protein [Petrocella sp. FN5]|uniref:HlyD family secretion protein n=1 Tax=Petrocella sp. FN5 TaxID=3032002 RepID=UPI0023DC4D0E|nr:biotin/lipoyl-binding protein [Petrocella sp. FN5]MDF1616621.1 biotin/lipoyl-binding protein [Petrocella sp. FN5]